MGLVPLRSSLDPAQCGLRTVFYARPGYSGSTPHPGRSVANAAADTAVVLDAIGADRFVTLGWSGGGPHALACAALLHDRCLAAAVVAGPAPFKEAAGVFLAEDSKRLRRVEAGDESELVKNCKQIMESASGARADNMADRFTSVADRESMKGQFADWMAEYFRASAASGVEGLREDEVAFAHDWGFKVAHARRVARLR